MKYFFSTLFGLLIAFVSISVLIFLSILVFPLPPGIDVLSIESLKENLDVIPNENLAMIVIGYAFASFMAGFSSVKIECPNPIIPLSIIGVILTAIGFVNFMIIPYPFWVLVVGSFTFFPITRLGGRLGLDKPL